MKTFWLVYADSDVANVVGVFRKREDAVLYVATATQPLDFAECRLDSMEVVSFRIVNF